MKRNPFLTVAALVVLSPLAFATADVFLPSFGPVSPAVKGMGGAYTGVEGGYDALFFNPAGFVTPKNSLTFLSVNPVGNVSLSSIPVLTGLMPKSGVSFSIMDAANALSNILTTQGVGAQLNAGSGWVGSGLGLGMAVQSSVFAKGTTVLGTRIAVDLTEALIIGYAIPLDLGFAKMNVGLDLRPMQRTYGETDLSTLKAAGYSPMSLDVVNGFGLGFDLGAQMDFGQVTAGLSVRDLGGTRYLMKGYTLTQVLGAATFTTGTGSDPNTVYTSPTSVSLGVDWQPDLGSLGILVQPRVVADWTMPMATLETLPSFWSCLHLGAEVKLLSYLALRAGLNQGWLTAGLGAHLAFVDLNIAVYSDELGRFSGANRRPAISAELAFRL